MGLWIKKFHPKISLVVHRHVSFKIKKRRWTRRKYLNDNIDQFIAVSRKVGEKIYNYGVPSHKIKVIHNTAPLWSVTMEEKREFKKKLAEKMNIDASTIFIGCAAAFVPPKGQNILIDALSKIKDKDFHCFFAGDGKQLGEMKALSEKLGLTEKITFLGHVHEMKPFFSAMDILVAPSREEAFGIALLEGIYCRCLVIASNVGGISEVIEDQKTGYLFPPCNSLKLSEILKQMIEKVVDINFLNPFLSRADSITKSQFSVEKMIKDYLDMYRKVVQKSKST